jgi:hypothetical protein
MDSILSSPEGIRGVIYCIEHTASGKKYVGQTKTHRMNKGKYRPYGASARFNAHVSEAVCNTKHKSGHLLGIDIRTFGKEAFTVSTLEICDVNTLDDAERKWITTLGSLYPAGYNLSDGGQSGYTRVGMPVIANPTQLNEPKKHGGCTHRSEETRAKMSARNSALFSTTEAKEQRSALAAAQHYAEKVQRFADVKIASTENLEKYIYTKGSRVFVRVDGREASFAGVGTKKEDNVERAKEFLKTLVKSATLPNCSGNP